MDARRGTHHHGRLLLAMAAFVGALTAPPPIASADGEPDVASSHLVPVGPLRLADTRTGTGFSRIDAHTIRVVVVGRTGSVDSDAGAVAAIVSVTLLGPAGYATTYPARTARPLASTVNLSVGVDAATNTAFTGIGADGSIEVFTSSPDADVIVDVTGVFLPAKTSTSGRFVPVAPVRAYDTRSAGTRLGEGAALVITLPALVPSDAVGVAVTVTAVDVGGAGYLTVHSAGEARPFTSDLNIAFAGQTVAAATVVRPSASGITVFSSQPADVVVDVTGYFTGAGDAESSDGLYVPLASPERRLDSRASGHIVHPGHVVEASFAGAPAAITGTITVTDTVSGGYFSAFAAGTPRPPTSSINAFTYLQSTANSFIGGVSSRGLAVFASAGGHVIVDQTGWFTGSPTPATGVAEPDDQTGRLDYPSGPCDTRAPGLEGLASGSDRLPPAYVVIGHSVEGRPIIAERWGPADATNVVLVIAQVHGNECSPQRLARAFRASPPHGSYAAWVIPTLNPDGYAAGTRENAQRLDLNQNGRLRSTPEARALMDFTVRIRPAVSVHTHSPGGYVAWYGTGRYQSDNAGASGAWLAGPLAASISQRSSAVRHLDYAGAGQRSDPRTWFLWQGQREVMPEHQTVLLELFAVSDSEVPFGNPRPPSADVATIDRLVVQVMAALEETL